MEPRGFLSSIFPGIINDEASLISPFLENLLDKVILNSSISKTDKIFFFGPKILKIIASLFRWDATCDVVIDDESSEAENDEKVKDRIHQMALKILTQICCSFKYGIVCREQGLLPEKSSNQHLLDFINNLPDITSCDMTSSLVCEVLRVSPNLTRSFFLSTRIFMNFDPAKKERWIQSIKFAEKVLSLLPDVPYILSSMSKSMKSKEQLKKIVKTCMMQTICIPKINRCINSEDDQSILSSLHLLQLMLEKIDSVLQFVTDDIIWSKSIYTKSDREEIYDLLHDSYLEILPKIQFFLSIWASKEGECLSSLLRILHLYQKISPNNFGNCGYDYTHLLQKISKKGSKDQLEITSDIIFPSLHKFRWFKKMNDGETSFHYLLKILVSRFSYDDVITAKYMQLLTKACSFNDVISDVEDEEMWIWMESVSTGAQSDLKMKLLESAVADVAKRGYCFSDELSALDNDIKWSVSSFPLLLCAILHHISNHLNCDDVTNDDVTSIDKFLCDVICEIFKLRVASNKEKQLVSILKLLISSHKQITKLIHFCDVIKLFQSSLDSTENPQIFHQLLQISPDSEKFVDDVIKTTSSLEALGSKWHRVQRNIYFRLWMIARLCERHQVDEMVDELLTTVSHLVAKVGSLSSRALPTLRALFLGNIPQFDVKISRMLKEDREAFEKFLVKKDEKNPKDVAKIIESFEDHLDAGNLQELLKWSLSKLESNKKWMKIAKKCSESLVKMKKNRIQPKLIHQLSHLLIKQKSRDLVKIHLDLVKWNSSIAFYEDTDLIKWCLDHIDDEDVETFLQILLQSSARMSSVFLRDLTSRDDVTSITDDVIKSRFLRLVSHSHPLQSSLIQDVFWDFCLKKIKTSTDDDVIRAVVDRMVEAKSGKELSDFASLLIDSIAHITDDVIVLRHRLVNCEKLWTRLACDQSQLRIQLMKQLTSLVLRISNDNREMLVMTSLQMNKLIPDEFETNLHKSLSSDWKVLARKLLKIGLDVAEVLDLLDEMFRFLYIQDSSDLLSPDILYEMIKTHSAFLPLMLSNNDPNIKSSMLDLLLRIIPRCNRLETSDLKFLFPSYSATLSRNDQLMLKIIRLYEASDVIDFSTFRPFLWGNSSIELRNNNLKSTVYKEAGMGNIIACFDSTILEETLNNFPIRRKMNDDVIESDDTRYDPTFLLPVLLPLFNPDHLIDCRLVLRSGLVTLLVASLSSHCPQIRSYAALCLWGYKEHLETARFSEKELLCYVIELLRDSITKSSYSGGLHSLPGVVTSFLACYIHMISQMKYDVIFRQISKFLLIKPKLDVENLPEFFIFFFNSSLHFKSHRSWMLNLLQRGVRDTHDFHVIERRQVVSTLMCFYDSLLSDNTSRSQVLQVLSRVCTIPHALSELINKGGLLVWMREVIRHDYDVTYDCRSDSSKRRECATDMCDVITTICKSLASRVTTQPSLQSLRMWRHLVAVIFELLPHCSESEDLISMSSNIQMILKILEEPLMTSERARCCLKLLNESSEHQRLFARFLIYWTPSRFDDTSFVNDVIDAVFECQLERDEETAEKMLKWLLARCDVISIAKPIIKSRLESIYCVINASQMKISTKKSCFQLLHAIFRTLFGSEKNLGALIG